MYKNKRIFCIIPARGGSKGVPGKNIKMIGGKPLIAYTIATALKSKLLDCVVVSTDDEKIAAVSKKYGAKVPTLRPASLAGDKATSIDAIIHMLNWYSKQKIYFDMVVLLHATSPIRTVEDIDDPIKMMFIKGTSNIYSVCESHYNPYFNMVEMKNGKPRRVNSAKYPNRQLAPPVYNINGSIYLWWKDVLKKNKKIFMRNSRLYIMPKERSIDIDDYLDFRIAEMMIKNG